MLDGRDLAQLAQRLVQEIGDVIDHEIDESNKFVHIPSKLVRLSTIASL